MRTWRIPSVLALSLVGVLAACGGDDGGGSADGFCDLARQADSASDDMGAAIQTGDPEEIERVFDASMDDLEAAVDAAPDAIQDVAAEVTETAQDLRDRLEELDWDVVAFSQDEQALELAAESEGPNTELDEFLERECGIPADDDESDPTDPPTTGDGTDGTDASTGTEAPSGAMEELLLDEMTDQFVALGLTEEQARCLGESLLDDLGLDGLAGLADLAEFDPSSAEGEAFVDAISECDIDPSVLAGS